MYACLDLEGRLPIPAPPICSADLVYTEVVKEGEEEVRSILCLFFSTHFIAHEGESEGGGTRSHIAMYSCHFLHARLTLHIRCNYIHYDNTS